MINQGLPTIKIHQVVQGIIQRPQIRVDLFCNIARQKAELFSGFHGRTDKQDAADFLLFQHRHGHCHGKVGLAGTGRADTKDDIVFTHGIKITFLCDRFRCYGPVA